MSLNNIEQALQLLEDENLEWSSDLEDIRQQLANLIRASQSNVYTAVHAEALARKIIYKEPNKRFDDIETR